MKSTRTLVTVMIVAVCAIGWMFYLDSLGAKGEAQEKHLASAEEYYAGGLYELAIGEYNNAIALSPSLDIYKSLITACEEFYNEETENTEARKLLLAAYSGVNKDYPKEVEYWEKHAELYVKLNKYGDALGVLESASRKGAESEILTEQYIHVYYAVKHHYQVYSDISDYAPEGYYVVGEDGLKGVVQTTAAELLPAVYTYVGPVGEDGAVLAQSEDGISYVIDEDGVKQVKLQNKVLLARAYSEGMIAVRYEGREDWCFVDKAGNELFGGFADAGRFDGGTAAVKKADGTWILIDDEGNQISEDTFEDIILDADGSYEIGGRAVMKKNGSYGMYDDDGESLNEFTAERMDISRGEAIAFMKGGKWGFVSRSGEVIIEPQYEDAHSFSCGVAAVKKDGMWGFINEDGLPVTEFVYEYAGYFEENGSCPVKISGNEGYSLIFWKVEH